MQQVAFIADDFGATEAVNHAIVRAHCDGVLTGTSLMLGQAATAHAVALARETPTLQIGWHVQLCDARPLTRAAWPWPDSPLRAGLALGRAAHRDFLAAELAAQWEAFRATGLRCAFVNGHHHLHVHPAVLRELRRLLPADYAGWVRGFGVRLFGRPTPVSAQLAALVAPLARRGLARSGFRLSDSLWGLDRLHAMQAAEIRAALTKLPPGFHEFIFHPRSEEDADCSALVELRPER
jgi:predicted glycoside hydrolase/deacetylase ChbG (UPF0249 family)